jgi:hypothetical protein
MRETSSPAVGNVGEAKGGGSGQKRSPGTAWTKVRSKWITPIGFSDITPELARESGFLRLSDLLKVAKHGKGENIYLIQFHDVRPRSNRPGQPKSV